MNEATKGKKKFGQILEGIAGTAAKNADFNSVLNRMIEISKENYPNAEGLVFDSNMSNASVITFNN